MADKNDQNMPPEVERNFKLLREVGEECVSEGELVALLKAKAGAFRLYDGFEPSGRMHIAQGVFKALNVNKCTEAGGEFVFWVADWFALMNDKMGGDLEKIQTVGRYLIEVWKAAGMNMERVRFNWCSEDIVAHADSYWARMLDITRRFTIARVKKCCQIMGRLENNLSAAQILYPLMQATDIFHLKADICQLGVDQRKVNMLAREYAASCGLRFKPIILSHHMLYGLKQGQEKMSKSDPDSAVFMEDSAEDVERKIMNAYCPSTSVEEESADAIPADSEDSNSMHLVKDDLKNPILDYIQHIIMSQPEAEFLAGDQSFKSFEEVKAAFLGGSLPEEDMKRGLIDALNKLIQPVRDHFTNDASASELLEKVRGYKREALAPPANSSQQAVERLQQTVPLNGIPSGKRVAVFAPYPLRPVWTLEDVVSLAKQLRASGPGVQFWLPDLGAIALGCLTDGEKKDFNPQKNIEAAYTALLTGIRAYDSLLLDSVNLIWESHVMKANPSDYWITSINVGRAFRLERLLDASVCNGAEQRAGHVVSALMHVTDVMASGASVLVAEENSTASALHRAAIDYSKGEAELLVVSTGSLLLKTINNPVERDADSEYLIFDNPQIDVKRKLTKAFCEPGNTNFNPVLSLANELIFARQSQLVNAPNEVNDSSVPSLKISRKAEHGGDVEYTCFEKLVEDFKSETLHPGDLKTAMLPVVKNYLDNSANLLKKDNKAKAAKTALETHAKKAKKAGK